MSEAISRQTAAPAVPPDHAFVPPEPGARTGCWHVVTVDPDGRDVHCNLARRQHPIIEDNPLP